jgi:hypothetical protein
VPRPSRRGGHIVLRLVRRLAQAPAPVAPHNAVAIAADLSSRSSLGLAATAAASLFSLSFFLSLFSLFWRSSGVI